MLINNAFITFMHGKVLVVMYHIDKSRNLMEKYKLPFILEDLMAWSYTYHTAFTFLFIGARISI